MPGIVVCSNQVSKHIGELWAQPINTDRSITALSVTALP